MTLKDDVMERLPRRCHRMVDPSRSSSTDCIEAGIPADSVVDDSAGCVGARLVRLGRLLPGISAEHGFWSGIGGNFWMGDHASIARIAFLDVVREGIEGSESDTGYCRVTRVDRSGAAGCGLLSMAARRTSKGDCRRGTEGKGIHRLQSPGNSEDMGRVDGLCRDSEPSKVSGFPVQKRILHWCRRLTRETRIRRGLD